MAAPKRNHLIHTAQRLFSLEGFKGVSVDRLLSEAGVAKMTLYKSFKTKDALIMETLRQRDEKLFYWFSEKVEAISKKPIERILGSFDIIEEWSDHPEFNGCYFVSALTEYSNMDTEQNKVSKEHKQKMLSYMARMCKEAKLKDPDETALNMRLLIEGATILKQTLNQKDSYQRAKQMAAIIIETKRQ